MEFKKQAFQMQHFQALLFGKIKSHKKSKTKTKLKTFVF